MHVSMIVAALAYVFELSSHVGDWRQIVSWLLVLATIGYLYVSSRSGALRYALIVTVGLLSVPLSFEGVSSNDGAGCILTGKCDGG